MPRKPSTASSPDATPSGESVQTSVDRSASLEGTPGVRFRSRHRRYRVGDIRCENHVATVAADEAEHLKALPECAINGSFWVDQEIGEKAVA